MSEESLLTTEIKAMVGEEAELPVLEEIGKASIIRYAHAISDLNPLYLDEEYAQKTEFGGVIAPPTYIFDIVPG